MRVEFDRNWDSRDNHQSRRSRNEVERIVKATSEVAQLRGSDLGRAERVTVVKGIHNDRVGAHITVQCAFETYHIYLTRDYDRDGFVWEPAVVCTGSQALQGDVARTKYSTGGTLYRTSR